jgi:hypothetical protein
VVISTKTCNQLRQLNEDSKFNKSILKILAKRSMQVFGKTIDVKYINSGTAELREFAFAMNERIFFLEFDIMSNIGFDLDLDLPFRYIDQMSVYFKKFLPMFEQKLTQLALTFMDNFYILPFCVSYEPVFIVLTCYNLIIKNCNITFPDLNGKKWYEMFMVDFNNEKMTEIGKQLSIIPKLTMVKDGKSNKAQTGVNASNEENINLSFYNNEKRMNLSSTSIEDEKDLNIFLKFNENKENKVSSINNPKSTYSEKITMDSDSNLDEQAFS